MSNNFSQFDGEELKPMPATEQRQTPVRRATDTNLEVIAHKTSRISAELIEFKTEMRDAIKRIENSITYTHATLHEATERAKAAAETARESVAQTVQDALSAAVPEGDVDGHRRHHEALIKKAEESAEFWANLRKKLAEWGLLGFLGWALIALWQAFLAGPKK